MDNKRQKIEHLSIKKWLSPTTWYIHIDNFISCEDNAFEELWKLHEHFEVHEVLMFGKRVKVPRKQGLFCDTEVSYNFSGCSVEAVKIPDLDILQTLQRELASFGTYNALFFNWYKDGSDYICAHRDDEKDLQTSSSIASLSFGATRTFRIRDYKTKKIVEDFQLNSGTLFIMGGDFQKEFTHEVPKTKKSNNRRINITCRKFKI